MRDQIELLKETAQHFLNVISAEDSVAVITFTTDVTVVSHLTKDREELRESIDFMQPPGGGTAFYDALGFAIVEGLRKVKGQRNVVIAITDGEDNAIHRRLTSSARNSGLVTASAGSFLTYDELLDGAKEADAMIYPIHLNPAGPQLIGRGGPGPSPQAARQLQMLLDSTETAKKQLQGLAEASGGRVYHADRIEDLKGVFEQVAAELRSVYSMAYRSSNPNFDGTFRRIKVSVNNPDVVSRTRPGYYAR
jgi:VWFA-related protein